MKENYHSIQKSFFYPNKICLGKIKMAKEIRKSIGKSRIFPSKWYTLKGKSFNYYMQKKYMLERQLTQTILAIMAVIISGANLCQSYYLRFTFEICARCNFLVLDIYIAQIRMPSAWKFLAFPVFYYFKIHLLYVTSI